MTIDIENESGKKLYFRTSGSADPWQSLVLESTKMVVANQSWELSLDQANILASVVAYGVGDGGWFHDSRKAGRSVKNGERKLLPPHKDIFLRGT